jgi:hypothetical protein
MDLFSLIGHRFVDVLRALIKREMSRA